ncbi:hypothetical protein B0H13DRAFT_2423588 [Mycena leptocephala]|nr:hypothetical protein B0H13DRAFT_2423588 [Mycena leptocephala]
MFLSEDEFDSEEEEFGEEDYFSVASYAFGRGSVESQISSDSSPAHRSFRASVPDVSSDVRQKGEHDSFISCSLDNLARLPSVGGGRSSASVDGFGLDPDWSAMQAGITALDMGDAAVDVRALHDRQPSQLSLILWRLSAGSITYDPDTFSAAVRRWGGEQHERQRKYWTFRRDEADNRDRGGVAGHGASKRPKYSLWKGMALNAEEFWKSPLVGNFRVRRIELCPQKPQQRVTIDPFRGPFTFGPKPPHDGAYTSIHKHSRVRAFSIHRHYKPPRADVFGSRQRTTGTVERSAMILLAPRHVQVTYTSTTTTKRLASHGLLDEPGRGEEPKRPGKAQEKESTATSSRDYEAHPSDEGFRQSSPRARPTFASNLQSHSRGGNEDLDTERVSLSTTSSESVSTLDASSIEQKVLAQEAQYGDDGDALLSRVPRRAPAHTPSPATPYIPPWVTLQSRVKQEERKRRYEALSNLFEDVGLLGPKKSTGRSRAKKTPAGGMGIFAQVPSDALFMLLPLWPGPTDPVSERNATKPRHEIPTEQRQYLLVSYKPTDERPSPSKKHDGSDSGGHRKMGSSHRSLTGSAGRECDILLTSYHISARLLSHADLQGSGVRVPDEGLAVLGPWYEAWLTMPPIATRNYGLLVIGTCASREAGIEFDPEGLVKMGLCIPVPPDAGADELQEEPVAELTPIGKAVLEMAWIGCMAVTSFGPAGTS